MKKKTNIKTIIRQIVREEVALAIQEVISELKQPTQQVSKPKPKKKIVEKKQYSKNSILNEVMNETAMEDEWKTMGGAKYTTERMNELLGGQSDDSDNPNGSLAAEMGVNPNDPTADFLKKDYRAIMKAVDKKDKQKYGNR